ncbi:hypothetical protein [Kineococcus rubinsiae]|uniref:hypothetical protein n=1 Tax=Kineococcus rubinsiae TaxID=2609562 RepID=UPI00143213DB|nr:hypothetical protein [Kineococcus rubinsiae]NIZ89868.1 hypothetical protein [Kineococcus rubinsiae]
MTGATEEADVPAGVLLLLRDAVGGRLLTDADGMAAVLTAAGWVRGTVGGSWACVEDPSWTVESVAHPPGLSVFTVGWDHDVARAVTRLGARLDAGEAGLVPGGEPDAEWRRWSAGAALVLLQHARQRWWGTRLAPAMLQLAVQPAGAEHEAPAPDPERARRVARAGSPVARWYLAGDATLPDDVVDLLAADDDPLVVAALTAGEGQRLIAREER